MFSLLLKELMFIFYWNNPGLTLYLFFFLARSNLVVNVSGRKSGKGKITAKKQSKNVYIYKISEPQGCQFWPQRCLITSTTGIHICSFDLLNCHLLIDCWLLITASIRWRKTYMQMKIIIKHVKITFSIKAKLQPWLQSNMTKKTATPIYGDKPSKFFWTKGSFTMQTGMKHYSQFNNLFSWWP